MDRAQARTIQAEHLPIDYDGRTVHAHTECTCGWGWPCADRLAAEAVSPPPPPDPPPLPPLVARLLWACAISSGVILITATLFTSFPMLDLLIVPVLGLLALLVTGRRWRR